MESCQYFKAKWSSFVRGQEIHKGIHDDNIEDVYQRLMSPSDNLSKMTFFSLLYKSISIEDIQQI
jgi:hypothetical protein